MALIVQKYGGSSVADAGRIKDVAYRVAKAKAAMHFSKVMQCDADGKPKVFIVPGSEAKQYQVILRRNNGKMSVEVNLLIGNNGTKPLYTPTVSYHGMCAVMLAAQDSGYKIVWCASFDDAKRLSNINGSLISVSQFGNHLNKMYCVLIKLDK